MNTMSAGEALKQKNVHFVRDKDNKIKAFFYKMPVKQKKSPTEIFYDKFNSK